MINLQNVSKKFGAKIAVDDISFKIGKGEVVGLLGPNGAGKTTAMRLITGFYFPTSGQVIVNGKNVQDENEKIKIKKTIGYLPENNPLWLEMKVKEYLEFLGKIKSADGEISEIIRQCGVEEVTNREIGGLSRGFKQRVGLSGAILGSPKILILDEPTSGLDPNQVIEIRELIKKLGEEKTVVLSTHILSEVEEVCTRAIIINKGRIVYDEKIGRVKGKLEKVFREVTLN